MNILLLTLSDIPDLNAHGIYEDLIRVFSGRHHMFVVSPFSGEETQTHLVRSDNVTILRLKAAQSRGISGKIKKGFATLSVGRSFQKGIRQYFGDVTFDVVLYATPPITLYHAVRCIKQRDGAVCYLMLKDIFPQNAVDLGLMSTGGVKGLIYRYFKRLEEKFYAISDRIGCMSEANRRYLLDHYPRLSPEKVEILPNSIEVCDCAADDIQRAQMRERYGIPADKTVFVYGGNLGKPQDIPFIIECLKRMASDPRVYFLIVGKGADFPLLEAYIREYRPEHVRLLSHMPRADYDRMIAACDVGLIFLDHRFTIPNFPSRLLAYMQVKLPVIACTDPNTDIGDVIEAGDFGVQCRSDSVEHFAVAADSLLTDGRLRQRGENGFAYLKEHYTVQKSYETIMNSVEQFGGRSSRR